MEKNKVLKCDKVKLTVKGDDGESIVLTSRSMPNHCFIHDERGTTDINYTMELLSDKEFCQDAYKNNTTFFDNIEKEYGIDMRKFDTIEKAVQNMIDVCMSISDKETQLKEMNKLNALGIKLRAITPTVTFEK